MQIAEQSAKAKRKVEAQKFKEEYLKSWKSKLASKVKSQQNRDSSSQAAGNPWGFIQSNIGQSVADYKGQKDVARMREVIVNKSKDK
jgi:hypothetical protein